MNNAIKKIATCIVCLALFSAVGMAQPPHHGGDHAPHHGMPPAPTDKPCPPDSQAHDFCHSMPPCTMEFGTTKACYSPLGLAVIDSVENAIELVAVSHDANATMQRMGHYRVDTYKGRYDLKKILRPVSLKFIGHHVVFLATAEDSSFVGVLNVKPDACADSLDALSLVAAKGLPCHSDAFEFNPAERRIYVMGFNPTGYDINIIDLSAGIADIANAEVVPFHYHVPKQAESIKATDPYGVGLTIVAVFVVFLALVCIALVLKAFGRAVSHLEKHKSDNAQSKRLQRLVFGTDEEVYVAIATAIYMYQDDLHDEEDNILTIQKVERAWTPWNAKFYNMNQYFNRKTR
ncbi:MAG: OadG family protein [Bacteroidales bacterium]|nr:OadG family protein [Bacteroidales bacterium]